MGKIHPFKIAWLNLRPGLRENEFYFVTAVLNEMRASFWAYANPVNATGCLESSIRLNGNFKADSMKCINKQRIQLQKGFTTGTDYVWRAVAVPYRARCSSQLFRGLEFASARAISSNKVGIAKTTYCFATMLLAA